jgi:hypothetical protein
VRQPRLDDRRVQFAALLANAALLASVWRTLQSESVLARLLPKTLSCGVAWLMKITRLPDGEAVLLAAGLSTFLSNSAVCSTGESFSVPLVSRRERVVAWGDRKALKYRRVRCTRQFDAIRYWGKFEGRWMLGNEFHFPVRPHDLPVVQSLPNRPDIGALPKIAGGDFGNLIGYPQFVADDWFQIFISFHFDRDSDLSGPC